MLPNFYEGSNDLQNLNNGFIWHIPCVPRTSFPPIKAFEMICLDDSVKLNNSGEVLATNFYSWWDRNIKVCAVGFPTGRER